MIPARYEASTSPAEQRIFDLLRTDPGAEAWTVLHSLGLARREAKPYGEIDFVLLIPDAGILCLEVKGGRVSCRDGVWRTRDRHGREHDLNRSPFLQAREGMFALRTALRSHFGTSHPASNVLIGCAVVFPDVDAPPSTTEFEAWQCIDIAKLRSPISHAVNETMAMHRQLITSASGNPSGDLLGRIRAFLRPDFEAVVARGTTIARSEERLLRLTEEQYDVLDSIDRNERCLVEGAAGTGKTVLALEYARRARADGLRTLLLCFNRFLGDWFTRQTTANESLKAGSFHRLLHEVILRSSYADEFRAEQAQRDPRSIFADLYPFFGELALLEVNQPADVLIIDEAQDLMNDPSLAVLNAWVRGGLSGGRWVMFGDFTRQALFGSALPDVANGTDSVPLPTSSAVQDRLNASLIMRRRSAHFAALMLRVNCRNTRPIGEETALLSGFDSLPYRLDSHDSLAVDYRWWRNASEQETALRAALDLLADEGVAAADTTILSPRDYRHSVVARIATDRHITDIRGTSATRPRDSIAFSTIHAFKGMESPVVILCDVDQLNGPDAQALLYVGMSRARSHLIVLLSDDLKETLATSVRRRLTREWNT